MALKTGYGYMTRSVRMLELLMSVTLSDNYFNTVCHPAGYCSRMTGSVLRAATVPTGADGRAHDVDDRVLRRRRLRDADGAVSADLAR